MQTLATKYFFMRYVDYETGELKFKFLFISEKEKRGAEGQVQCFKEALASLYPQKKEITAQNIIDLLKKNYSQEEDMEPSLQAGPIPVFGFD